MFPKSLVLASFLAAGSTIWLPPSEASAQNHVGQTDTDGILSPGERPNPDINYRRAQREGERFGDQRVDNPANDAAADAERDRDGRAQYGRDRRDQDRRDQDRYDDSYRGEDRERRSSWWNW